MKKVLAIFALLALINTTAMAEPKDIAEDCDYKKAVETVLEKEVMGVDTEGNFLPDKELTRAEFLHCLLKVLNVKTELDTKNPFSDVKEDNQYYNDIMLSSQLGLIYGYNNGTFMPDEIITHSEATSIISHITKDKFIDCSTLKPYTDREDIPDWAKLSYSKSLNYGVCVNNAKHSVFEPNNPLTKKECAIVLSDLIAKLAPKPEAEKPAVKENLLSVEHIAYEKKSLDGEVQITNLKKVIKSGNTFFVKCVDETTFILPDGLKTNEGTVLFDKGAELSAIVVSTKPVSLEFCTLKSDDKEYQISAKLAKTNLRRLRSGKKYQIITGSDINL